MSTDAEKPRPREQQFTSEDRERYRKLYKAAWRYLGRRYPEIRVQRGAVMVHVSRGLVADFWDGEPYPDKEDAFALVDEVAPMYVDD